MSDQFDLGSMLSQAMAMQQQFEQARADAAAREFIGRAGGGAVAIRVTGGLHVLNVSIAPEAVDPSDVAMLEDLVLAAFHDALAQIDEMQQEILGPFQNAGMPDLGDLAGLGDLASLGGLGGLDGLEALGMFGGPEVIDVDETRPDDQS